MCNLSEDVWEKGMEKGTETEREKFILNMNQKGYSLDQIADVVGISADDVKSVIMKKEPAMA